MILDRIENMGLYEKLSGFEAVVDFIKNTDIRNLPDGKYTLKEGIYYMVMHYDTKPAEEGKWEAHRNYIDLQLVLEGTEEIYKFHNEGKSNEEIAKECNISVSQVEEILE